MRAFLWWFGVYWAFAGYTLKQPKDIYSTPTTPKALDELFDHKCMPWTTCKYYSKSSLNAQTDYSQWWGTLRANQGSLSGFPLLTHPLERDKWYWLDKKREHLTDVVIKESFEFIPVLMESHYKRMAGLRGSDSWILWKCDREQAGLNLIEMNVLHAHILHHGCLLIDVGCDHTKRRAALTKHSCEGK